MTLIILLIALTPVIYDYVRLSFPRKDTPNMSFLNKADVFEMRQGLRGAFPPGTPKEYVEKALIDKAGAKYNRKLEGMYNYPHEQNVHSYKYRKPIYLRFLHDGRYTITIFYDENDHVKEEVKTSKGQAGNSIRISGPTGL